jgi:phospholipid-binding lipoprotein MlaA
MIFVLTVSISSLADELPDALADTSEAGDIAPAANPDPWESVNRRIYAFNDVADRYLLKPVAKGYQWVMPQFMEDGVHRMFVNVGEVSNTLNCLLQAKFVGSGVSLGRLLINSTVGLAGFFDVASKIGLEPREEDFGQTLGYWGVDAGPFIVVPLLGPRTLRDGAGSIADVYTDPVAYIDHTRTRNVTVGTRVLDTRVQLLPAEELITGDRYIFIRDAYLQRRAFLVNDGVVEDEFGGEDF